MNPYYKGISWKIATQNKSYRLFFLTGSLLLTTLLAFFPYFFKAIELRKGVQLNDFIIERLPSIDLSIPIFSFIWVSGLWMLFRCIQNPITFLLFLWSFLLLGICRLITISITPLDSPHGLIKLRDFLSNTFYGGSFVTKDLFFSGHTSTQFLIFLCLNKRLEKVLSLLSTIAVGTMVIFQHVHYSIDVLFAPLFAYLVFLLAKRVITPALKSFS